MTIFRTRQEIFDLAWNGLKAQGFERSLNSDDTCAYRGENGMRCAIGFCIDDANYDEELLEENLAQDPAVLNAARIAQEDNVFAEELQEMHDTAYSPEIMEEQLRAFALRHKLKVPEYPSATDTPLRSALKSRPGIRKVRVSPSTC